MTAFFLRHSLLVAALCSVNAVLSSFSAHAATAGPTGTWKAERLGDAPLAESGRPPVISIAEDGTVSGFSGCNRVRGKARVDSTSILFGPMLTTRMACLPQAMKTEQLFLKKIEATRGWQLAPTGTVLTLVDTQNKTTVVFHHQSARADESSRTPPL